MLWVGQSNEASALVLRVKGKLSSEMSYRRSGENLLPHSFAHDALDPTCIPLMMAHRYEWTPALMG